MTREKRPENTPESMDIIDSHTGGEPTRVVVSGWPQPPGSDMESRLGHMRDKQDHLRRAVVCEPRGHDAIVGALLTPPVREGSFAGVVFFNDVGYLGMCGHALIGTVATLKFMGRFGGGRLRLDTPAGTVSAELDERGYVTLENVPSYLYKEKVSVEAEGIGRVTGDIGYGGNWFFMMDSPGLALKLANLDALMTASKKIRAALEDAGIRGPAGEKIDHVEFYGDPVDAKAHSRNFVLCPGNAYDRAPCGTGTSAKMAALHKKGRLDIGQKWIQESITGSLYEGHLLQRDGQLVPVIKSTAHVVSQGTLFFDPADPFCWGIADAP
jgi:4-hydroxyproline epimerase